MNPKDHSRKVVEKAVEKARSQDFTCSNCTETFTSESERRKHEEQVHGLRKKDKTRHA